MARSFCGDLGHRQAAHLQSTTQRQADHGKGADQHADRDQLAYTLTHLRSLIAGRCGCHSYGFCALACGARAGRPARRSNFISRGTSIAHILT
jgi:hypothetical protein